MLAEEPLVDGQGERQHAGQHQVLHPVEQRLQVRAAGDAGREVAHPRRQPRREQQQCDRGAVEEVPQRQPVPALEVAVGAGALLRGEACQVRVGRRLRVEAGRLRRRRRGNTQRILPRERQRRQCAAEHDHHHRRHAETPSHGHRRHPPRPPLFVAHPGAPSCPTRLSRLRFPTPSRPVARREVPFPLPSSLVPLPWFFLLAGGAGETRTRDTRFRKPLLYPY